MTEGELEPDHRPDVAEGPDANTGSDNEAQTKRAEDPFVREAFERTVAECQPPKDVVPVEAFRCALDFEDIDPNWGPLVEAHVMGSLSENQANLLSLTVRCKTTICGVEVIQAATVPPSQNPDENHPQTLFERWFLQFGKSFNGAGLQFSRIYVYPTQGENRIIWEIWIPRLSYD